MKVATWTMGMLGVSATGVVPITRSFPRYYIWHKFYLI
jgi:hypothetical protein